MIATDFASNESWDDAWISFKMLFQPWRWQKGNEVEKVKKEIVDLLRLSRFPFHVSLYLTGRSALYNLLKSLNLPKETEVIIQAFTCEAVVLPILANNLKPIYVDIETKTLSMDIDYLQKKITKNARVLILQHTFGLTPLYRKQILELAKKNNLFIIEDLAHGFSKEITFNQCKNQALLLSFGRSKIISSVFGGAIITQNNKIIISQPSMQFIFKALLYKPLSMLIKSTYDIYLGKIIHKICNFLSLLLPEITRKEKRGEYDQFLDKAFPNALAILLHHQLNKFERISQKRAKICDLYENKLKNFLSFNLHTLHQPLLRYPILVKNRNKILETTSKLNIFLGKWYDQVVAPKGLDLNKVNYKSGSCSLAENVCQKIINLPTNISEIEANKIIKILNDVSSID